MPRINLEVRRSFRVTSNQTVMRQRQIVLENTARKVQRKAIELATKPKGLGAGTEEGLLAEAILVEPVHITKSGASMAIRVYASTLIAPHAAWQEYGTGKHGTGPFAGGDWIRPKSKRVMSWIGNANYRGRFIKTRVTRHAKYRTTKQGRRVGVTPIEWAHFAQKVRGVQPKHYMKQAREDKTIQAEYLAEMAAITRNIVTAA